MRLRNAAVILIALAVLSTGRSGRGDFPDQEKTEALLRWLSAHRDQATALPYSHVGDPRFERWTITYDAAVTALAYTAVGNTEDAGRILDFYLQTPQVWRLGGIIEAYVVGPSFEGKDWSVRTGANLWMGMAAFRVYQATKNSRYLELAVKIADLAISLQNKNPEDPNFGGIPLGPAGDPAFENDQLLGHLPDGLAFENIFATEVNIDAYALFSMLAAETKEERYVQAGAAVFTWLKTAAYNQDLRRFNRGFGDATFATDVHSWGISALGSDGLESIAPGLTEAMAGKLEESLEEVSFQKPDGTTVRVRGVDFVDHASAQKLQRGPMVSAEWTFQLANAWLRLERDFRREGVAVAADEYAQKRADLLAGIMPMAIEEKDMLAFPYATLADAPIGHEYATPSEGNVSAIGAAYGILALQGYDPLDFETLHP